MNTDEYGWIRINTDEYVNTMNTVNTVNTVNTDE